ncbi:condensin subunit ScpA [Arboricoccus pini]|uniref:Segregation and condensation protein A n=1 Tax=Arboricoccus pini TaxID=1963835 RepID=A0A212QQ26_9PROT|nr:ScpA family protein [Arboricoccus pini]SNB61542.1 condensin subunit ScpA [Arboricoccus pini]
MVALGQSEAAKSDVSAFVVALDEFEGPLDLLLELARAQKLDLKKISLVALADQYLDYLKAARAKQLEIAAEYLVMAAWLAYLKSQLLLPRDANADPDAATMAEALAARLRALEAIRHAALWLEERAALGTARFARGAEEPLPKETVPVFVAELGALLRAYGVTAKRQEVARIRLPRHRFMTVDVALARLSQLLTGSDWRELRSFLPPELASAVERRAAVATSLVASLELARSGEIELLQQQAFGPILVRRRP